MSVTPSRAMVVSTSCIRIRIALLTPLSPKARAYKNGRPNPTAFAPSARALTISVPRIMPPSTITSQHVKTSGQCFRIDTKVSTADGAPSSCRPAWLESHGLTLQCIHNAASSQDCIPLTAIGRSLILLSHLIALSQSRPVDTALHHITD